VHLWVIDDSRFGRLPTVPLVPVRQARTGTAPTMDPTARCTVNKPRGQRHPNQEPP